MKNRRILAGFIAATMFATIPNASSVCLAAQSETLSTEEIQVGPEITAEYNIEESSVLIDTPGNYYVYGYGNETVNNITINADGEVSLTIENINCNLTNNGAGYDPAIEILNGEVTLLTEGENSLRGQIYSAAILHGGDLLTIAGNGILNAYADGSYPVIETNEHKLIINSGTINAYSGIGDRYASSETAVIGASRNADAGEFIINGGTINIDIGFPAEEVSYSYNAVGIGSYNACESITINGGEINFEDRFETCIGGKECNSITISGGDINIQRGYVGIGAWSYCKEIVIEGGNIAIDAAEYAIGSSKESGKIVIYDGKIDVINAGYCGIGAKICELLEIRGGLLNVMSGQVGIGGTDKLGTIMIYDGDIFASGDYGPGIGSRFEADKIIIYDGNLEIYGGDLHAAIGCGYWTDSKVNDIIIHNGNIKAYGAAAGNKWQGAAIGSGRYGTVENITIYDGIIYAEGADHAAAIGSGMAGRCGTITIAGGDITAKGGSYSAAIGSGSYDCVDYGVSKDPEIDKIIISGGYIKILDRKYASTGIGIGSGYIEESPNIMISGGTIEVESTNYCDIGSPEGIKDGTLQIDGGNIYVQNLRDSYHITDQFGNSLKRLVAEVGSEFAGQLVESISYNAYGIEDMCVNTYGTVEMFVPESENEISLLIDGKEYVAGVLVSEITLNNQTLELSKGNSETLVATILPDDATNKEVVWTSSNPLVATVDENGLVTAIGAGTAVITATTVSGGKTATCTVTVRVSVEGVTLNITTTELTKEGQTLQLIATIAPDDATNKDLIWASRNSAVASVDSNGLVTAVGNGSTEIVVTTADGYKRARCRVTVDIKEGIVVISQPSDKNVKSGEYATFTVEADGEELSYQWQYSTDGKNWKDSGMSGNKTASLTVEGLAKRNGQMYRCVITDASGDQAISSVAKLIVTVVKEELAIVTQPVSKIAKEGEKVVFTVEAKGEGLTYQWQYSTDGKNWGNSGMTGAKTANLTVEALSRRNGQMYRCAVTDGDGNKVTSNAAILTVTAAKEELAIVAQPASKTVKEGETAVFTVVAKGEGLTYQWQFKAPNASEWKNSGMTGAKTASLHVVATLARNGQQYRCIVTDGDDSKVISNAAKLMVTAAKEEVAIVTQPASKTAKEGEKVVFDITAKGENLTYQWQFSKDNGTTWKASGMTGAKTASLTVEATLARNGQQYRCIVTDGDGSKVISNVAKLMVTSAQAELTIVTNPADQTVKVGKNAVFTIEAEGEGLTYQWQFKTAGTSEWKNSGMTGAKTASLTVVGTVARNGQQYRCVVTDSFGNTVTSKAAELIVSE